VAAHHAIALLDPARRGRALPQDRLQFCLILAGRVVELSEPRLECGAQIRSVASLHQPHTTRARTSWSRRYSRTPSSSSDPEGTMILRFSHVLILTAHPWLGASTRQPSQA
jgi:hypothetical protein